MNLYTVDCFPGTAYSQLVQIPASNEKLAIDVAINAFRRHVPYPIQTDNAITIVECYLNAVADLVFEDDGLPF